MKSLRFVPVARVAILYLSYGLVYYVGVRLLDRTIAVVAFAVILLPVLFGSCARRFGGFSRRDTIWLALAIPLVLHLYSLARWGHGHSYQFVASAVAYVMFSALGWHCAEWWVKRAQSNVLPEARR